MNRAFNAIHGFMVSGTGALLVASMVILTGCSATSFQGQVGGGEHGKEQKKEKKPVSGDAESGTKPVDDGLDEGEEEKADRPSIVAGAFLACVDVSDQVSAGVGFGCSVRLGNERVELAEDGVDWRVVGSGEQEVPADVQRLGPEEPYHVLVTIAEQHLAGAKLMATVHGGLSGDGSDLVLSRALDEDRLDFSLQYGEDLNFHLGNGDFSGSSCRRSLSGKPVEGTRVTMTFEVLRPRTRVAVAMTELCGVDIKGVNPIRLKGLGADRELGALEPGAGHFETEAVTLSPGRYQVEIESSAYDHKGGFEHDDFVIGGLFLFVDREISQGEVEIFDEALSAGEAEEAPASGHAGHAHESSPIGDDHQEQDGGNQGDPYAEQVEDPY